MDYEEDGAFLPMARDMLDIEMSSSFKKANVVLTEAAEKLKEIGVSYVLKFCESEHNQYENSVSMHIACKCSEMDIATAGALLEYEQQRFISAVQDARDGNI